jgi:HJR/Mrr/RecB family endonuclease
MSPDPAAKRHLTQLNREIDEAEAEVSRLEAERSNIASEVGRATRRQRYLRFAQRVRAPATQFEFWPLAVMFLGPVMVGVLFLVLVQLVTASYPAAFFAFLLGIVAGVGLFAALIYHPADNLLPAAIGDAESQQKLANARLQEKLERLSEAKQRLQQLLDERRDQVATGKLQRAALLQRNWKSMRDAEWEDFIVEVCRTHGAKVERIGPRGSDEANLIADFGPRRIVILAAGEGQTVNSETIHEALAAKDRHRCEGCAVIINRRFTGAAQDFATRKGCAAIGASEFPDFVLGKIEI